MVDERIAAALEVAVERGEVGVQVAAYIGDQLIIDASIGAADSETGLSAEDALFPIFSVTKGVMATAMLIQADRGLLHLDEPIATYWPEYACNGKDAITSRHILTHRGGVPHMPAEITPADLKKWDWIVERMAAVEPISAPGDKSIYHALSFGYILGEVLRRTDPKHRLPGEFFRDEIFTVVGADDFYVGLPANLEPQVAKLTWGGNPPQGQVARTPLRELMMPVAVNAAPEVWNLPEVHQCCMPAGNGITNARSGAKFFSLLANGGSANGKRLISEARLRACLQPRENPLQLDEGIGMRPWLSNAGFFLAGEHGDPVLGPSTSILASAGAGGSVAWADLDSNLSVMITHNRMFAGAPYETHPFAPLAEAVRDVAADYLA